MIKGHCAPVSTAWNDNCVFAEELGNSFDHTPPTDIALSDEMEFRRDGKLRLDDMHDCGLEFFSSRKEATDFALIAEPLRGNKLPWRESEQDQSNQRLNRL